MRIVERIKLARELLRETHEAFGGWTEKEYDKMSRWLGDRFQKQYQLRKEAEEREHEMYKIAMDTAERYRDMDRIKELLNLANQRRQELA